MRMAKFDLKLKAFTLRRRGWSINTIAKELGVAKSTTSIWCRDLELTPNQRQQLKNKSNIGRLLGARANHNKKLERISYYLEKGEKDLGNLSERDLFIAGIALYWAEGTKKSGSKFSVSNSDPKLILFVFKWLKLFGVKKSDIMPRVFINSIHETRMDDVVSFWAQLLKLPVEQFGKPVLLKDRPKKIYENHENYYGVMALHIRRGSELKYKTLGLIEAMSKASRRSSAVERRSHNP